MDTAIIHPVFAALNRHQRIAIDFDGTLVNNPNSHLLWEFIKNSPQREFCICTFRTGHLVPQMAQTLNYFRQRGGAPSPERFKEVLSIPTEVFNAGQDAMEHKYHDPAWSLLSEEARASMEEDIKAYTHYKGAACAEHGYTALIDDLAHMVEEGCVANGIEFINANHL